MKNIPHFLSLLVILLACKNQSTEFAKANIKNIDLNDIGAFNFGDVIDEFELIPLETNDSLIIGDIFKFSYTNNRLHILDTNAEQIFVFSNEGQFIGSIFNVGKGFSEYIRIEDYCITRSNRIYILDAVQRKLLEFDLFKFEFVQEIKLNFDCIRIERLDNGKFLFYRGAPIAGRGDQYQLYLTDSLGNIEDKFLEYENGTSACFVPNQPFQKVQNITSLLPIYEQTIYSYDNDNGLGPKFSFDFGRFNINKDLLLNNKEYTLSTEWLMLRNIQDMIYFLNYYESTDFIHLYFYLNEKYVNIIYSKKSDSSIVFEDLYMNPIGYHGRPKSVSDNGHFMAVLNPSTLMTSNLVEGEESNDFLNSNNIREMINQLDYLDNPIIMMYTYNNKLF